MSDVVKHECAVAFLRLRREAAHYVREYGSGDFGGSKLSPSSKSGITGSFAIGIVV